jgi:hypothetical protein
MRSYSQCPRSGVLTIGRTITMFKSVSNSLILRGVLALIVGIIALGIELRRTGKGLHSILPQATKAA